MALPQFQPPTLESELAALDKAHAAKVREIHRRHYLGAMVRGLGATESDPRPYGLPMVMESRLHGSDINVYFKRKDATDPGVRPVDSTLLRYLLTELPPVARVLVHDGCTSLRVAPNDGDPMKGTVTPIAPISIELDFLQEPRASVQWVALMPTGELAKITVELPVVASLGTVKRRDSSVCKRVGDTDPMRYTYSFANSILAKTISWSSGTPGVNYLFTLYWPEGDGPDVDALVGLWQE